MTLLLTRPAGCSAAAAAPIIRRRPTRTALVNSAPVRPPWPPEHPAKCTRAWRLVAHANDAGRTGGSSSDAAAASKRAAEADGAAAAAAAAAERAAQHAALLDAARAALNRGQLPAFVEERREELTTGFLSHVADLAAGRGRPTAAAALNADERAALRELFTALSSLKEAADWTEASRQLPAMAASLAYANYERWRRDQPAGKEGGGGGSYEVAPGVSLEDVYRAGERAELRLQREGGAAALRPPGAEHGGRGGGGAAAAATAAYGDFAAAAMARVRARLSGYDDDRPPLADGEEEADAASGDDAGGDNRVGTPSAGPAARRVLRELLRACECREERAEAIALACVPPGIPITSEDDGAAGGGAAGSLPGSACTTPDGLLAAIAEARWQAEDQQQQQGASGDADAQALTLPSGEPLLRVLAELEEDTEGYGAAVYARLSPLERFGGGAGL